MEKLIYLINSWSVLILMALTDNYSFPLKIILVVNIIGLIISYISEIKNNS